MIKKFTNDALGQAAPWVIAPLTLPEDWSWLHEIGEHK